MKDGFENNEAARVTLTVEGTYKLGGERKSLALAFHWEVAYRDGRWEIIHNACIH